MSKKIYLLLLCSLAFLQSYSQTLMPIPAHGSLYTGSARGFWFTAPTNFIITGLRVPSEAGTGAQYIHVMKCNDPFPVAFGSQSTNFTTLQYINGATNGVIQNVSIPVNAGDVIGILGTAGTGNSYSASAIHTSTILGFTVTLTRFGYQGNINTGPAPMYWGEASTTAGQISRVEMYYTSAVVTPPSCLASPVAPSQGSTNICSGSTTLRWRKSTGATGYDVYMNAGSGSPTTSIASNIPDTFLTTTTGVGIHTWRVVPKNSAGSGTGCPDWNFTTIPGITPDVTITVSPNDTICYGSMATYTATPVNPGTAPVYQWLKNNVAVGTNNPVYQDALPANNDIIKVVLTSNATGCLSTPKDTSGGIKMTVLPTPSANISASGPVTFCYGGSVTINAPTGGVAYQWLQNGVPLAGATSSTYTANFPGYYNVKITTGALCPSLSDSIKVIVFSTPFPLVDRNGNVLSTSPNYTSYQWYRNNQQIPGATTNTLTISRDGQYKVIVTDTTACAGSSKDVPVNSLDVTSVSGMEISIFPNPVSSTITVNSPVSTRLMLRSIDGKLVREEEKNNYLDVSKLAEGLYMLYIYDTRGHLLKTEKITRQDR